MKQQQNFSGILAKLDNLFYSFGQNEVRKSDNSAYI